MQYLPNDTITITIDTEAVDIDSIPAVLSASAGGDSVTLSLIRTTQEQGSTEALYRVTNASGTSSNVTIELKFDSWQFQASKLKGKPVAMTIIAATNGGITFSTEIDGQLIIERYSQTDRIRVTSTTGGDKTLSWDENLMAFESGTSAEYSIRTVDNYVERRQTRIDEGFDVSFLRVQACFADAEAITTTLTGDFSWWLAQDETTSLVTAQGVIDTPGGWSLEPRLYELSATQAVFEPTGSALLNLSVDLSGNTQSIPEQALQVEQNIRWKNCDDDTQTTTLIATGTVANWEVDGVQVEIPYLPYRHDISQKIILSHSAPVKAGVYARVVSQHQGAHDLGILTHADPNKPVLLHDILAQALLTHNLYNSDSNHTQRFAFDLRIAAPPGQAVVHSEYTVAGNTALVVNSTNLRM